MKCFTINLKENTPSDITDQIQNAIGDHKGEGILAVISSSSTTGLLISEGSMVAEDIASEMSKSFPARSVYKNRRVSPMHHAANIRAALTGKTLSLLCADNNLILPNHQRVFAVNYEMSVPVEFTVMMK